MRFPYTRGASSVMVRVFIPDNSVTTGAGLTGLTSGSTNLAIAYSRSLQNGFTQITGANLATITTIGTWASPGTGKLGFKAVDATNAPGLYEIHFPNDAAAFGSGDASIDLYMNILELTTTALKIGPNMVMIPLTPLDYQDGVRFGLTGLANAVPGASGGLFIAGTNAATTVTTSFTTTFTGNLTGSVASVTGLTASNLDTTISSRMASYTQPAGFLAATFPSGTIANTTNITAGIITTTTNLTNLPSIPANWLTATGTAADFGTEVSTAVWAKTLTELAAVPGATAAIIDAINFLFMAVRNKRVTTTGQDTISNDAGGVIATASISDLAGVFTKDEYA